MPDATTMATAVKAWTALQQQIGAKLWRGAIGLQDGLILPANWLSFFSEKVLGDDALGLRFPYLHVAATEVLDGVMTRTLSQSKGANIAPALQVIVGFLTLYAAECV